MIRFRKAVPALPLFILIFITILVATIISPTQSILASENEQTQISAKSSLPDQELPATAAKSELEKKAKTSNGGGLLSSNQNQSSLVDGLYQKFDHVRHRFSNLVTYGSPLAPEKQKASVPDSLWKNELVDTPLQLLAFLGAIWGSALLGELFFKRYMMRFLPAVAMAGNMKWYKKLSTLMAQTILDMTGLFIFLLCVTGILLCLPKGARPHHIIVSSCFTAIILVKAAALLTRALLAPNSRQLRLPPITTETARYIQIRILLIANIGAFGWLTSVFIELFSTRQSVSFLFFLSISIVVCGVLISMCLEKRDVVREILRNALPKGKVIQEIVRVWHHLAIFYVITIWVACFLGLLLVGPRTIIPAGVTILAIPCFFLADSLLQKLVDWWLHVSKKEVETDQATSSLTDKAHQCSKGFAFSFRLVIRVVLAALLLFNILSLWGIDLEVGKFITSAAMNSIVATLICVIIWGIANRAVERKLTAEMPDQDEEMEEGGAGGSRTGTLLILFRKFLFCFLIVIAFVTVLSSLGINIGPLIAGAGVIGLAIGFGAQTLVKDIISGIFFLMDDAFRVGDFVDTGSSQGTVEHISLRSLRIRHARGMVHTIPFGDISSVTNYSRDYIITKLDFRVPFDTDVDKIRKIVKRIYNEILEDEELGPKLLGKMKSQGVRELDDSALIMRIKFKTIPGEQFVLRREVYRRLQEAFHRNGLEFASRKVMVEIPKEAGIDHSYKEIEKAAAATLASQDTTRVLRQDL
jgi:small-conductance mechanosensitive channel